MIENDDTNSETILSIFRAFYQASNSHVAFEVSNSWTTDKYKIKGSHCLHVFIAR